MSDKMQDLVSEEMKNDLAKLRRDLSVLSEDVKKILEMKTAWVEKIGANLGQDAGEAWGDVQRKLRMARARGEKAIDDVAMEIEDHPWKSILVACGMGVIIGLLIPKRNK
ncbi:MAG: hypothetical protein ABSH12_02610 [Endomicrobiales bacterium]|jgi:ElaB/YqjD/DUF883 family membrane-anchored ribosome-binding protein